ncbi:MAG: hypothetical protein SCARUB_04126 [Candidatus Scalindua rubra]|uniref:Uncharacterized protein n=1 Tax=Candidatus Scalindua rubra TaxID=1872076 RepID=A0A1E3X6Z8_9BACT|nr:MAG: hypothetical protein SCARUB_04126 [Candidatus Scalindua rubra]
MITKRHLFAFIISFSFIGLAMPKVGHCDQTAEVAVQKQLVETSPERKRMLSNYYGLSTG